MPNRAHPGAAPARKALHPPHEALPSGVAPVRTANDCEEPPRDPRPPAPRACRRHECSGRPRRGRALRRRPARGTGQDGHGSGRGLPAHRRRALRPPATGRQGDFRARRRRPPPGPPGLGADRPAAAGPAGRRPGAALAVLHVPAAGELPGHGHGARRDVLHRARPLRQVAAHVLPVRDQDLAAPRGARDRAQQGHPRRADPAARRRPDPHRRRLSRGRPAGVPRAERRREGPCPGPARPRVDRLHRVPGRQGAA
jgi:hypothetical protein